MMRVNAKSAGVSGVAVVMTLACAGVVSAQQLATRAIVSGLTRPVEAKAPAGDNNRLFVAESRFRVLTTDPWSGRIRIVNLQNNTVSSTPFFSVSGVASTVAMAYIAEQGLLGFAFHPDYRNNGYFYVHYTRGSDSAIIIARARANPPYDTSTTADAASLTTLLTIPHTLATNHNGGWMEFGPDGNLYFSVGDGGSANDPTGNAQSLTNLLGKISRIDVDGPDNIPGNADDFDGATPYRIPAGNPFTGAGQRREIWAYGLRNPWRNAFDRGTGDLYIADVGQDAREELNVAVGNPGGRNYGWRCVEGTRCTGLSGCTCTSPLLTAPVLEYSHDTQPLIPPTNLQGCSITGGRVYRGCDIPWLAGTYFFTDYCAPALFSLRYTNGAITDLVNRTTQLDPPGTATIDAVSSFAEDARGEMYILDQSGGEIFKIVAARPTFACNTCVADVDNGSGTGTPDQAVSLEDLLYYLGVYDAGQLGADVDDGTNTGTRDGGVTLDDLLYYLARYERGC